MSDPTNPYAIPQSNVAIESAGYGEIRLFSSQGRIGRLRYMAYSFSMVYGMLILAGVSFFAFPALASSIDHKLDWVLLVIAVVALSVMFMPLLLSIQRLHDMDRSGWFVLLFLIPILNGLFMLVLMFMPGNAESNQYGAPPPPNSLLVKIFGVLPVLIMVFGILSSIFSRQGV